MQQIKQEIENIYQDYKIFDIKVKKESEELKSKEDIFKKIVSGENLEDSADDLANFYKDSILKNSQLRMIFEQLMFLIETYIKYNDDLPDEIKDFYNQFLPYKTKKLYTVENEEIVVVDEEVLNSARKQLDNNPLIKMIASSK